MDRHRSLIIMMLLGILGFALIAGASTFDYVWAKIALDQLMAGVGALLLVVGVLQFLFEWKLREEMIREVSDTVVGSTLLHDSGLVSCNMNAREVDDQEHWLNAANLTIGRLYSPKFFKDFYDMLRARCTAGRPTTAVLLAPDNAATRYLQETGTGTPKVEHFVSEIRQLLGEVSADTETKPTLLFHDRVLRYSFIRTDECIWVKFFTNSRDRAIVPAFKVRSGTPLYKFFNDDIERLVKGSREG
ncbi:hypothetical protein MYX65_03190 [Acidobacteria bacterium AH-259-L09]|nr:hypothetical protein [Acidobacteria bacterium AH-259-L09]